MSEPWPGHIRLPDKAEDDVLTNYSNPKTNLGGEISFFFFGLIYSILERETRQRQRQRQKKHEYKWKTEYKKELR